MNHDIEKLLNKARKEIRKYCIEECKAYCCRKGNLTLTTKEAELITRTNIKDAEKKGLISINKNQEYNLEFKKNNDSCPALKENKCTIHKNKSRPQTCKDFPIYLKNNIIMLSNNCPAITNNKLYAEINKIKKMGYEPTNITNVFKKKDKEDKTIII